MSIRSLPVKPVTVKGSTYVTDKGTLVVKTSSASSRHIKPKEGTKSKPLTLQHVLSEFPDRQPLVEGQKQRAEVLRSFTKKMHDHVSGHGYNQIDANPASKSETRKAQIGYVETRRRAIVASKTTGDASKDVQQSPKNPQSVYQDNRPSNEAGTYTSDGINPEFKGYSQRLGLLEPHERAQVLAISGRKLLETSPDVKGEDKDVMKAIVQTFENMRHDLESHPKGNALSQISKAGLELIDHYSKMNFDTWLDKVYPLADILGGAHPEIEESGHPALSYAMEEHSINQAESQGWSALASPIEQLLLSRTLRTGIRTTLSKRADEEMKKMVSRLNISLSEQEKGDMLHTNQEYKGSHLGIDRRGLSAIDDHVQEVKAWKTWKATMDFRNNQRLPIRSPTPPEPSLSRRAKEVIVAPEKRYAFRQTTTPKKK